MFLYLCTSAIAHYQLTNAQTVLKQCLLPAASSPQFCCFFHMMSHGMDFPFHEFRSTVLILSLSAPCAPQCPWL